MKLESSEEEPWQLTPSSDAGAGAISLIFHSRMWMNRILGGGGIVSIVPQRFQRLFTDWPDGPCKAARVFLAGARSRLGT